MKVLVVDDDKLARKGLISIMDWGKYGFEVVGDVQNGRKALEFLKDNVVDIVFTDIDMPEIDGIELMKRCKKEYPEVKFVVFSMYEDFRYAQSALRLGALDYISKTEYSLRLTVCTAPIIRSTEKNHGNLTRSHRVLWKITCVCVMEWFHICTP